jgi:hypothetical protein
MAEQTRATGLQFYPVPKTAAGSELLDVHKCFHEEVTVLNSSLRKKPPDVCPKHIRDSIVGYRSLC